MFPDQGRQPWPLGAGPSPAALPPLALTDCLCQPRSIWLAVEQALFSAYPFVCAYEFQEHPLSTPRVAGEPPAPGWLDEARLLRIERASVPVRSYFRKEVIALRNRCSILKRPRL